MDDYEKRTQEYYDRKVRRADETFFLLLRISAILGVIALVWHLLDS